VLPASYVVLNQGWKFRKYGCLWIRINKAGILQLFTGKGLRLVEVLQENHLCRDLDLISDTVKDLNNEVH